MPGHNDVLKHLQLTEPGAGLAERRSQGPGVEIGTRGVSDDAVVVAGSGDAAGGDQEVPAIAVGIAENDGVARRLAGALWVGTGRACWRVGEGLLQRPSTRTAGSGLTRCQWCRSSETAEPTRWS